MPVIPMHVGLYEGIEYELECEWKYVRVRISREILRGMF